MAKKKLCAYALANGHLSSCPHKNLTPGENPLEIDFSASLGKCLEKWKAEFLKKILTRKEEKPEFL